MKTIHTALQDDLAYIYSIENNDVYNMQIVLRAHSYDYTEQHAIDQIAYASSLATSAVIPA